MLLRLPTSPVLQVAIVLHRMFQDGNQLSEIDLHLHGVNDQVPPGSRIQWKKRLDLPSCLAQAQVQKSTQNLVVLRVTRTP